MNLLPCPFCGGEPRLIVGYDGERSVECGNLDCTAATTFASDSSAIAAWNTRKHAQEDAAQEGWHPMDSAPKDGTRILAAQTTGLVMVIKWVESWGDAYWADDFSEHMPAEFLARWKPLPLYAIDSEAK